MDRPTGPPQRRPSRLAAALTVFFLGENRMPVWQRFFAIILFAGAFALLGDLFDVAARLVLLTGA